MKISVAICTWNRSRLLDQTLESISKLKIPPKLDWELIVVDNNSTEPAVPFVLADWRKKLPLKILIEKEQGHSAARNCAVNHSSGDYIIWTDNDVLVSENWLSGYVEAFRNHPEMAFFGGEIKPRFEHPRPAWIQETWKICSPVFATRELGETAIELGLDRLPYGANFAIRADVQRRFAYDTQWGRKKTSMVGEDEVAVLRQVIQDGGRGLWVPGAKLEHFIPPDRATPQYIAAYYFGQGYAKAFKGKTNRPRILTWADAVLSSLSYQFHRRLSRPKTWVSKLVHSNLCWGELSGLREIKNNPAAVAP
ncbi:MAG: glycosyltransferase [Planctomycetota bacterium]|nr:glycosyltransferase [Planctomycetota bacterium]